jgi:hypothetical protein
VHPRVVLLEQEPTRPLRQELADPIGFSNGFLSFAGDLFILCMPLPMIWYLRLNQKKQARPYGHLPVRSLVSVVVAQQMAWHL